MLKRLAIEGIEFPRLYIAENNSDVEIAKQNGIPYIKWKWGQEKLIKQLLRPTLEKMFPGIAWDKVLGKKKPIRSLVCNCRGSATTRNTNLTADYDKDEMLATQLDHDSIVDSKQREGSTHILKDGELIRGVGQAESLRCFDGGTSGNYDQFENGSLLVEDYIGDLSSSVDIEVLQKLGLLPKFVGDVTDCIKHNFSQSLRWTEGYTKKLGVVLGKFSNKQELPNLIIIDCSSSIPDGIAATMLTLADTLRSQCNAELIITSNRSGYYPVGAELPSPQTLLDYYGRCNERAEFIRILEIYIAGREFGHVISFGDNDCPGGIYGINMQNTVVHAVHHYHTRSNTGVTGYARWVDEVCPGAEHYYNKSWCNVINKSYRLGMNR